MVEIFGIKRLSIQFCFPRSLGAKELLFTNSLYSWMFSHGKVGQQFFLPAAANNYATMFD